MKKQIQKIRPFIGAILIGGFFFLLDQTLKFFARTYQDFTAYLFKPYIGWEFFANPGIAFSLPVPQSILLFLTPLILLAIVISALRQKKRPVYFFTAVSLILFGAVSNFVDRFLFSYTIDYMRIYTSVINIADIMIVVGAILLFFSTPEKKQT